MRVRLQALVGIFFQEIAEGLFGQRVVLMQYIAVSQIVLVLRRGRRRQRGKLARRRRGGARRRIVRRGNRRGRHGGRARNIVGGRRLLRDDRRPRRFIPRQGRQIERGARGTTARSANWRFVLDDRRTARRHAAERARRAWCVRLLRRIEHVGAAAGSRGGGLPGRRRCARRHGRRGRCRRPAALLQAQNLLFELLIAVLQLLDGAGHLAQRILQAVEPHREFGRIARIGLRHRAAPGRLRRLLAAGEKVVEESGRAILPPVLRGSLRQRPEQQRGEHRGKCRETHVHLTWGMSHRLNSSAQRPVTGPMPLA